MDLPDPRGPITAALFEVLSLPPHQFTPSSPTSADTLCDDDFQLALYTCYELHYRGFEGVDERWEWEPSLLAFRQLLEATFESDLRAVVEVPRFEPREVPGVLQALADDNDGPSLSRHLESHADLDEFKEFLKHRSIYHLREADSHTWALPRLSGRPKAALVEIQMDEYGSGVEARMHATLFRDALGALGLRTEYRAYLDEVPAVTLATVNLMSLFGLHRRFRGACVGHLALFEMTSTEPNRRYAKGLRRLGLGQEATAFFDEHVEADSIHEQIAANDLAGSLAAESDAVAADIIFGASALAVLDDRFARHVLERWGNAESSLRVATTAVSP